VTQQADRSGSHKYQPSARKRNRKAEPWAALDRVEWRLQPRKCHELEIDHGDIVVRQPRNPRSRKINMSSAQRPYRCRELSQPHRFAQGMLTADARRQPVPARRARLGVARQVSGPLALGVAIAGQIQKLPSDGDEASAVAHGKQPASPYVASPDRCITPNTCPGRRAERMSGRHADWPVRGGVLVTVRPMSAMTNGFGAAALVLCLASAPP
jgi:hypothetical protein